LETIRNANYRQGPKNRWKDYRRGPKNRWKDYRHGPKNRWKDDMKDLKLLTIKIWTKSNQDREWRRHVEKVKTFRE
jgi:hypothetical protein